ncbi:hypothetical protein [Amycolatopsis sp. lyj-346]|uniref:hypothetical protein n=1 Tax=Amycolatopsis sp. lyj-346 TaxID=2789289 RepID=UPI003978E22B
MPPHAGWQAALIAAGQALADHGSLGLVAADETELELKIVERAAAIVRCRVLGAAEACTGARATLDANPGARLAVPATPGGCSAMVRVPEKPGSVPPAGSPKTLRRPLPPSTAAGSPAPSETGR